MNIIDREINDNYQKFISIDEMIRLIADISEAQHKSVVTWLILKYTENKIFPNLKVLILSNDHEIEEYEKYNQSKGSIPPFIDILKSIEQNNYQSVLHSDDIGFAKHRLLIELKEFGFDVPINHLLKAIPYIPTNLANMSKREANYVSLVFEDIRKANEIKQNLKSKKTDGIQPKNYPNDIQILLKAYQAIIVNNSFSGRAKMSDKIKDFLENNAPHKKTNDFFIKAVSSFINSPLSEIMEQSEGAARVATRGSLKDAINEYKNSKQVTSK